MPAGQEIVHHGGTDQTYRMHLLIRTRRLASGGKICYRQTTDTILVTAKLPQALIVPASDGFARDGTGTALLARSRQYN